MLDSNGKLVNPDARIETTTRCNANCTICSRDTFTRPIITMPNAVLENIVKRVEPLGAEMISLFGFGEPLCDREIEEKVFICSDIGLNTFLTTNAGLLTETKARNLIGAGLSHIRFSVHGMGDNYEKVHRGLNWINTMDNIMRFIHLADGKVITSVSVIPLHGETVDQLVDFWSPGKLVNYLEVWKPHNWADKKRYRGVSENRKRTCGRPFSGPLQINADGTMMICCFDINGGMTVGDTKSESIEGILTGGKYEAIREKHRTGDLTGLPCETCDQLNVGDENPLLYSNRDPDRNINCTSSTKFQLKEN